MSIVKLLKHLLLDQFTLYGGGKGGGGGDAPDPPDPYAVAGATTQTNQDTAAYNKALNLNNYSNPFGSQQSVQTGVDPNTGAAIYNTNITASPQLQGLLGSLLGQTGQSSQNTQAAIDHMNQLQSAFGGIAGGVQSLQGQYDALGQSLNPQAAINAQNQGRDAAYASQTQYLDPQFSQSQESLDAKLANSGLTPGSQAYANAQLNQSNAKQQAYSNAMNQAILTGSQIGTQNWQNQLAGASTKAGILGQNANLLNTGLQNINQSANLYGQVAQLNQLPYSNLQTIAGMVPGYAGPAQSSTTPANIGQNIYSNYQAGLNNYNAQQQSANQFTGGLFGLGSAGLLAYGMSDRRVKRDVRRIGTLKNGLPWYSFRYLWSDKREEGVMSDEVRRIKPEAVAMHVSGFEMVDYAQVM